MKHSQLIFVTFAGLALAQSNSELDRKAMTQQEVLAKFQKSSFSCYKALGDTRLDELTPLCQENGGCKKCYLEYTIRGKAKDTIAMGCDIAAQNNASARPQETPKPQETKPQPTPQVLPQEVEKLICTQFKEPEDECHPAITQCVFEQKKKPDNFNSQKDFWKAVNACASKVLTPRGNKQPLPTNVWMSN
ncbi:hypothetical protein VB005_07784 [Metarhizium brunneum]